MKQSDLDMAAHTLPIQRWRDGLCTPVEDPVAEEVSLHISVNGVPCGSLHCSPWSPEELVIGYLYTLDMLADYADVTSIVRQDDTVCVELREHPSCKAAPVPLILPACSIPRLIGQMEESSVLFRHTGGVHTAALSDGETILATCEDIGRRNALDRLIGRCLIRGIPMAGRALLFSGRVPEEIVRKAAWVGCGAILSVSAPTSLGVQAAEEEGILLVGFVRGNRFNVYTFPERIQAEEEQPAP